MRNTSETITKTFFFKKKLQKTPETTRKTLEQRWKTQEIQQKHTRNI